MADSTVKDFSGFSQADLSTEKMTESDEKRSSPTETTGSEQMTTSSDGKLNSEGHVNTTDSDEPRKMVTELDQRKRVTELDQRKKVTELDQRKKVTELDQRKKVTMLDHRKTVTTELRNEVTNSNLENEVTNSGGENAQMESGEEAMVAARGLEHTGNRDLIAHGAEVGGSEPPHGTLIPTGFGAVTRPHVTVSNEQTVSDHAQGGDMCARQGNVQADYLRNNVLTCCMGQGLEDVLYGRCKFALITDNEKKWVMNTLVREQRLPEVSDDMHEGQIVTFNERSREVFIPINYVLDMFPRGLAEEEF